MSRPDLEKLEQAVTQHGNVLLYGPPGTGKTELMRRFQESLEERETEREVSEEFNPDAIQTPFRTGDQINEDEDFPGEIRTEWLTFHESMSYSEFMLGLRPRPTGDGTELVPRAGTLLELAEHAQDGNTSVLFIDELNRANVSEVFGQFITAMEPEKRLASDGSIRSSTVGITLPQVDEGESIRLPGGSDFDVEMPYYFPANMYIVASMNSLDRSTAPLDSALARRFEQIQIRPDYKAFKQHLTQNISSRSLNLDSDKPIESLGSNPESVTPEALSLALLNQVNTFLRGAMGDDFQLGPGYLWRVGDVDEDSQTRFNALVSAWDARVIPKLRELFRSRGDQLELLLRPDGISDFEEYPYSRTELTQRWERKGLTAPLETPPLAEQSNTVARRTLHSIATQSAEE
ncbi:AAA family ATPase [Salinigranum sp. GCM10025319]|uniref:AAA family ATPase n=1 Tax=Salinigranum sp. GCM10025319 TaxID=3252687 RepID=UPI0036151FE5